MQDIHFHQGYRQYALTLSAEQLQRIDYTAGKNPVQLYKAEFTLTDLVDTFIDCRAYGKGVVIVNGINLGRYWQRGPIRSLYCPKEFLKKGTNEVVIFLKLRG
ncbi:glycosyl hydrolase [Enterococcus sp. DIV0421]